MGWFRSADEGLPVDKAGNPIPWYPYAMSTFLDGRINSDMEVFEYGSGNSTLWWSKRVSSVTSCEHDLEWFDRMKTKLPPHVDYMHCELETGGKYCQTILDFESKFDCIIVDGRDRVNCAKNSLKALKPDGVIVWDDSEREYYQEGYDYLADSGFRRLDFWGLGPNCSRDWCTSIFYRDGNRLKI
jgi:hypothetical protein